MIEQRQFWERVYIAALEKGFYVPTEHAIEYAGMGANDQCAEVASIALRSWGERFAKVAE